MDECKPLVVGQIRVRLDQTESAEKSLRGRGLHSFPFPLNLSSPWPFPLNLSLLRPHDPS